MSKFLLVGLGAIGSTIYARLVKSGYSVICLTSERGALRIQEKGLLVQLISEKEKKYDCNALSELSPEQFFDFCIIAVKSYHNEFISKYLVNHLRPNCSILLFENGLDVENDYLKANPTWSICRAMSSHSAIRDDISVVETAVGETIIGLVSSSTNTSCGFWIEMFNSIGLLAFTPSININYDIWLKALSNCAINPLGAITGYTNGELLKNSTIISIMSKLLEECLTVVPENMNFTFDAVFGLVKHILNLTKLNKCSMLQDIINGRKTEIDSINGQIVQKGKRMNRSTPINEFLVNVIKQLESKTITQIQAKELLLKKYND